MRSQKYSRVPCFQLHQGIWLILQNTVAGHALRDREEFTLVIDAELSSSLQFLASIIQLVALDQAICANRLCLGDRFASIPRLDGVLCSHARWCGGWASRSMRRGWDGCVRIGVFAGWNSA